MNGYEAGWYVLDEESQQCVRGPYQSADIAGAVRDEMWRQEHWQYRNLKIAREGEEERQDLERMTFRALNRVIALGTDVCNAVFDAQMSDWFAQHKRRLPDDERQEWDAFHKVSELLNNRQEEERQ